MALVGVAALALVSCSDSDESAVDRALDGMGGADVLAALDGVSTVASGTRFMAGEGSLPEDPAVAVSQFYVSSHHDIAGERFRLDYERDVSFPFSVSASFSEIVAGDVGVIAGTDNLFGIPGRAMLSDRWAATVKQERLLNPHLIVREIARNPARAEDGGIVELDSGAHELVIVGDDPSPINLYVSVETGRLSKATTLENSHLLRDVMIEASYDDWREHDGLFVPAAVTLAMDGEIVHTQTRSQIAINPAFEPELFALPEGADPVFDAEGAARGRASHQFHERWAAITVPLDGLQTAVVAEELAPGIFYLTGGTHNSLAIEQDSGIVIVEAPLYPERSEAILAWADGHFPGKSITHVIATHHHEDHSAGLRAFVARGATVVLSDKSRGFFEEIFQAPSSVVPDALEMSPTPASIASVSGNGPLELDDPSRAIAVYPIDSSHASDMVIIYMPGHELLFNSDLYSPNSGVYVTELMQELHDGITAHGLDVTTIAGGHGGAPATLAELEEALGL